MPQLPRVRRPLAAVPVADVPASGVGAALLARRYARGGWPVLSRMNSAKRRDATGSVSHDAHASAMLRTGRSRMGRTYTPVA